MRAWLPSDPSRRRLVVGIVCSIVFHLLLVAGLFLSRALAPPVYTKRGEPLFVDITPDKPREPAPIGRPDRPVEPERAEPARRPPPPAAARPTPPAAKPAPPAPRAPAEPAKPSPSQVAKAPEPPPVPAAPEPAPVAKAPEPAQAPSQAAQAARPEAARPERQPEVSDPKFALAKPSLDAPPSIFRRPGSGGGLRGGGRGGVEGEPIPLDTPDPKYQDYFNQVRERIKAKWIYPREAGERGIAGQLLIEFHIARDGQLAFIELRRSSGVEILDDYAVRAIQLAQPFPPVPAALAKAVLPISGMFTYQIIGNSFVNQYLR